MKLFKKLIVRNTQTEEILSYESWMVRWLSTRFETYTNLSKVGIRNKVNPDLKNDYADFSVEKFNPLKYFFNFYSASQMNYRVDNTNYMIIIVPRQ